MTNCGLREAQSRTSGGDRVLFKDCVEDDQQIQVEIPDLHGVHMGAEPNSVRSRMPSAQYDSTSGPSVLGIPIYQLDATIFLGRSWRAIGPVRGAGKFRRTLERSYHRLTDIAGDS